MTADAAAFAALRPRLHGLAYRMLGSASDADDVLQDAWLRLGRADPAEVRSLEAYLVTVVTRLCLDHLRSARARRETYVGPWLPEPLLGPDPAASPEAARALADDLSFALLLTLQRLSGPERAAFLLHDVFDASFAEIAAVLGRSEAACRQLATRARRAVRAARPAPPPPPEAHRALLARFVDAVASGDIARLQALLAADAVAYSDGGGVRIAALRPIRGAARVARFFLGLARKARRRGQDVAFRPVTLNGAPGLVAFVDGALDQTFAIDVADGRIAAVYVVRNPDKLAAVTAGLARAAARP
ncbi:MAG: RNA polymerase sigma factor SigJ [Alphaproteobacteria bacterium]